MDWKPNTTMNIPVFVLERTKNFLSETPEVKSRNIFIEGSLTYVMDHWEDIKEDFLALIKKAA